MLVCSDVEPLALIQSEIACTTKRQPKMNDYMPKKVSNTYLSTFPNHCISQTPKANMRIVFKM